MAELLGLIVLLGLVTYRVGRFIVLDTLIEDSREWFMLKLRKRGYHDWHVREPHAAKPWGLWARKLEELLGCPFCVTVWIAAGAAGATRLFVGPFAMPVWVWLGAASVALVVWRIVDWEDDSHANGD